jgi:hypothetical protein
MSIKFSSSTNSNGCGISGGISGGQFGSFFSGQFGSVLRRKFRCCWGGVIIGFECFIVLGIQFIFLPIILIIWGILIIGRKFRK